ncbi:MAG TPA: HisA/HisF-related TIM barrel protein [Gemmataceae bacterium]|jgi:phosphoribosylformimino-5-aminoimidazole carboxamide ribotide isomerase|nr:HisA/HisF-related TIM barrel protein [Gemmataceae bacterium]
MRILPVLDIQQGKVVRGVGGRRHEYQPIVSKWARSTEPLALAEAMHAAYGFRDFYLADLDAIAGQPPSWELFARLLARGFRIAVDAGIREELDGRRLLEAGVDCVIGLETVAGPDSLRALLDSTNRDRLIFSLDLKDGEPLGNLTRWRATDAWSIAEQLLECGVQRLIVLDLARVGVGEGVGTEDLCRRIKRAHPRVELIAGGGVGGIGDLRRLEDCGVDQALVASALHDGRLGPEETSVFG